MENNVVKGEVSISSSVSITRSWCSEKEQWIEWFRNILSQWGMNESLESNDRLVIIDVTGDGCKNWHDYGKDFNGKGFPGYIPFDMIKNLKEGETIRIEYNGVKIELTAAQLKYGYRVFGKFEEVLKKVLSNDW